MTDTLTTTTEAFVLTGPTYELQFVAEAEERKRELLAAAAPITEVSSNEESAAAQFITRKLAGMRNMVEKARKAVKEPVLALGKRIDADAAEFLAEIAAEETRIKKLVADHAAEVARIKREKEAAERRAFEEARKAREAAEAAEAAAAAASATSIKDRIAAVQAERERQAAAAARMAASAEVAATRVADGVRFALDFEVIDAFALLEQCPELVRVEVKRSETLAQLKEALAASPELDAKAEADELIMFGLRVFKRPVVSSR